MGRSRDGTTACPTSAGPTTSTACPTARSVARRWTPPAGRRSPATTSSCSPTCWPGWTPSDEGNGTMLDNSVVYIGSEFGDGNAHDVEDQPLIIAGGAGGKLRIGTAPGRARAPPGQRPAGRPPRHGRPAPLVRRQHRPGPGPGQLGSGQPGQLAGSQPGQLGRGQGARVEQHLVQAAVQRLVGGGVGGRVLPAADRQRRLVGHDRRRVGGLSGGRAVLVQAQHAPS